MAKKCLAFLLAFAPTLAFHPAHRSVRAGAATQEGKQDQKRRRAKFGSSLKRLKWDPISRQAIEGSRPGTGQRTGQQSIKLSTLFVLFDVSVTGPRAFGVVTGLGKDDFTVMEDGQQQQIAAFEGPSEEALPRQLVLILDMSGSQRAHIHSSIEAAKRLVSRMRASDEMALVTDDVELISDFTPEKGRLVGVLDLLERRNQSQAGSTSRRHGRSLQFSALLATLRELTGEQNVRSIVIFQTDGDEAPTLRDQPDAQDFVWNMPRREFGLNDIYTAAMRSRATIYTVIPGDRLVGIAPEEVLARGRQVLEKMERARFKTDEEYRAYQRTHPLSVAQVRLFTNRFLRGQAAAAHVADITGGWPAFFERPDQAAGIYSRIVEDLNRRYVIGYYPTNTKRDGSLRQVRIEVPGHPEFIVQGRTNYYAPAGD